MPSCIMKLIVKVDCSPGLRAIAPMVGVGGQQPSSTSIYGCSLKRSVSSPTLERWNVPNTVLFSGTSARSTNYRSTFKLGEPVTSIGTLTNVDPIKSIHVCTSQRINNFACPKNSGFFDFHLCPTGPGDGDIPRVVWDGGICPAEHPPGIFWACVHTAA